uniref:Uncharacterized protein n=1 Tax=Anopheles funestus TaxID=62324 RepID=A0A182RIF6_ANOFN
MLERFHLNKDPIITSLALLGVNCNLTARDWIVTEEASNILKFFDLITKEVSAEKSITLSKTKVIVMLIIKKLLSFQQMSHLSEKSKKLIQDLHDGVLDRFNYLNTNTIAQATILDPRFKKDGFDNDDEFKKCYDSIASDMTKITEINDTNSEPQQETQVEQENCDSFWSEFDNTRKETRCVSL